MTLELWNQLATPPLDALKKIQGGRLSGKTDINPQWRTKIMTEHFGPCGVGWRYTIDKLWLEPGQSDEVFAFSQISLYVKVKGEWSEAIPGIGGHKLVEAERGGLHNNDEAFKMATTDALSVAMKMLGVAADIYLGNFDGSKYQKKDDPPPRNVRHPTEKQLKRLYAIGKSGGWDDNAIHNLIGQKWGLKHTKDLSISQYNELCGDREKGARGTLEDPPPETPLADQARYDEKAMEQIEGATDWLWLRNKYSDMLIAYSEKSLDETAITKAATEKMLHLAGHAIIEGGKWEGQDGLEMLVEGWRPFSDDQRAQLRTTYKAMKETSE